MRDEFADWLYKEASSNSRLMFLTADLGFGVFENFKQSFPHQYLNVGVAEQNLVSVASGLALSGRTCFIYSIANFPVLRCLEQIRNDAAYHNANVKIVSIGGGFSYGNLGFSHHATEDIAIMRSMQNVEVYVPGTLSDVNFSLSEMTERTGVSYLRLDKSYLEDSEEFEPPRKGSWRVLKTGHDIALVSSGGITREALMAGNELEALGLQTQVVNANILTSIPTNEILRSIGKAKMVITVEEHAIWGGLGGIVCEAIAKSGINKRVVTLGIKDGHVSKVGSQAYLRLQTGIDSKSIVNQALSLCAEINGSKST